MFHLAAFACAYAVAPIAPGVLHYTQDKYDGVLVDPTGLNSLSVETFTSDLKHSIQVWTSAGKRGIWLQLPVTAVHLVAPAVGQGFLPHHAEPTHIMLVRWLPSTPNTLPPSASHQVGVGAFVVNARQEVLVVQERNGPLRGMGVWKMPTGLIHQGEDLHIGAEREVLEETGIHAKFECVLAVRQAHGFAFSYSDLFLVVGLVPEPGQDTPVPQESEVSAAKWMPLTEYMQQPFMQGVDLYDKLRERCAAYARGTYKGWRGAKMEAGLTRKRSDLLLWGEDDQGRSMLPGNGSNVNGVSAL